MGRTNPPACQLQLSVSFRGATESRHLGWEGRQHTRHPNSILPANYNLHNVTAYIEQPVSYSFPIIFPLQLPTIVNNRQVYILFEVVHYNTEHYVGSLVLTSDIKYPGNDDIKLCCFNSYQLGQIPLEDKWPKYLSTKKNIFTKQSSK